MFLHNVFAFMYDGFVRDQVWDKALTVRDVYDHKLPEGDRLRALQKLHHTGYGPLVNEILEYRFNHCPMFESMGAFLESRVKVIYKRLAKDRDLDDFGFEPERWVYIGCSRCGFFRALQAEHGTIAQDLRTIYGDEEMRTDELGIYLCQDMTVANVACVNQYLDNDTEMVGYNNMKGHNYIYRSLTGA